MKGAAFLLLLVSLFLSSCSNSSEPILEQEQIVVFGDERIIYEYKGVSVTRITEGTESRFYFGNYKDSTYLPGSYIKSTFHGFNSGMDAYLIFNQAHVEIYYSMDHFENVGDPENIQIVNSSGSNTINSHFEDKVKGHHDNVCRVSDILKHERELNAKNHSKVKAGYPAD